MIKGNYRTKIVALITMFVVLMVFSVTVSFAADNNVAKIGTEEYPTLNKAIENVQSGETITILRNVDDATGIKVQSGSNFTIDFNGYAYTLTGPGAGSSKTETNGFQFLKDSTITLKNGTIKIAENANNIKRIIQNYADLTLENMTFYSENQVDGEDYALSFNNGNIVFKGDTSVITTSPDVIAFDVCKFSSYPSVSVTFDDSYTGDIKGTIIYDSTDTSTHKISINGNGTFANVKLSKYTTVSNVSISGGTFDKIELDAQIDSDMQAIVTSNGVSKIAIGKSAVEDAITALKSGDTIEFKSVSNDAVVEIPEGVTITNNTGKDMTINGVTVIAGDTVVVQKVETTDPSDPQNPSDTEKPNTEKPTTSTDGDKDTVDVQEGADSPKTGDDTMMVGYAVIMLAAFGIAGTIVARRKKNEF